MKFKQLTTLLFGMIFASPVFAADDQVAYPNGYRQWTHTKSMLITPGHPLENPFQGIHHIYANEKARKGMQKGIYQDGAVIVFDLLNYESKDKTIQEGSRKLIGVMHKDAQKYSATGGWGFEAFAGNSKSKRLVNDKGMSCYACHAPQKKQDFVFSKIRE